MTLREKIKELRLNGKTYDEIATELRCSKGTISYHCNENVKYKTSARRQRWRHKNTLAVKLGNFIHPNGKKRKLYRANGTKDPNLNLTELTKKIGDNPRCYLTGDVINLNNPQEYSLDHIVPLTKGGQNTLENCGLISKNANVFKSDLLLEDVYRLCEKILRYKKCGPSPQSSGEPTVYETVALTKS